MSISRELVANRGDELAQLIEDQRQDDLWGHRVSRPNQLPYIDGFNNPPPLPRFKQPLSPEDSRHGTKQGYNAGCRLACCRAAAAREKADTRSRMEPMAPDDPRHGTANGYKNRRCRCKPCTRANTVDHARYMERRRARDGKLHS